MSLANRIADVLGAHLGREVSIEGFARKSGGASRETYLFDALWPESGAMQRRGYVLRRDPIASLLESDRTHEYRVIEAAGRLGIPVPRTVLLELRAEVLDRPFFVMERVDGMPTPPSFPAAYPDEMRDRVAREFLEILARLHAADWRAHGFDFLPHPGDGDGPARIAIAQWRKVFDQDRVEAHPLLERAFGWLATHAPAARRITIVHGDYRSGNYLHDMNGGISAILDWEMAHLGDPLEDLGWATMPYWSSQGRVCGHEPEDAAVARYEALTGAPVDRDALRFWQVLGTVKMAVISLTGVKSYCEGRSNEPILPIVACLMARLLGELCALLDLTEERHAA